MTSDEFRKMALEIPKAIERTHMNHPDFRVTGKIFASLGVPDENWGMVKLTPEQQRVDREGARGLQVLQRRLGPARLHECLPWLAKANIVRTALNAAAKNVASRVKKNRR
jgi:hypothetical protein